METPKTATEALMRDSEIKERMDKFDAMLSRIERIEAKLDLLLARSAPQTDYAAMVHAQFGLGMHRP